jgi:beta-phosphoglucomutase-like phosphatase (HAD superfamily)
MLKALIFDVDGVLVDSPHERAWGETFARLAPEWCHVHNPSAYTNAVYQAHVAGRPRLEGASALLARLGVRDPDGERASRLAEEKQARIARLIDEGAFAAYPDALRLVLEARAYSVRLGAASSSKNALRMLSQVNLAEFASAEDLPEGLLETPWLIDAFDASVCGREFALGKPDPAIFLACAGELEVAPRHCVVVEDAPSGVRAAKNAGMRCIGVARHDDEAGLRQAGADRVVLDLDEFDLAAALRGA